MGERGQEAHVVSVHIEQRQEFTFPAGILVSEFDKSAHHTKRATSWCFRVPVKLAGAAMRTWEGPVGQAGVDFATWTPATSVLQLIEVKDYRVGATGLPSELPDVVARKVRDSLATLAIARAAGTSDLHGFARSSSAATGIVALLDVEFPPGLGAVRADLQQKLNHVMKGAVPVLVTGPGAPVNWTKRDLP